MPSPFFSFAIPGTSLPLSLPFPPHPNPVISTEAVCAFANCVAENPLLYPFSQPSPLSLLPNFRTIPNKGRVMLPREIPVLRAILWIKQHHHTGSDIGRYINELATSGTRLCPIRESSWVIRTSTCILNSTALQ